MVTLALLSVALAQGPCAGSAEAIAAASARVAVFDLSGALLRLAAAPSGCADVETARWYLRGVLAAREASRAGGSSESLEPVREAVDALGPLARETTAAEVARAVLLAASAAAQSERAEMAVYLDLAVDLERQQAAIGAPGAPVLPAGEVAGDLWLQVHGFAEARAAYLRAAPPGAPTPRVLAGLARAAVRVDDRAEACRRYRELVNGWPSDGGEPAELIEAQAFLGRSCGTPGAPIP